MFLLQSLLFIYIFFQENSFRLHVEMKKLYHHHETPN